jgi:hypothetical protein
MGTSQASPTSKEDKRSKFDTPDTSDNVVGANLALLLEDSGVMLQEQKTPHTD